MNVLKVYLCQRQALKGRYMNSPGCNPGNEYGQVQPTGTAGQAGITLVRTDVSG